jgi:hypothetical protein
MHRLLRRTAFLTALLVAAPAAAWAKGTSPFRVFSDRQEWLDAVGDRERTQVDLATASSTSAPSITTADGSFFTTRRARNGTPGLDVRVVDVDALVKGLTFDAALNGNSLEGQVPNGGVFGLAFNYSYAEGLPQTALADVENTDGRRLVTQDITQGLLLGSNGFFGVVIAPGELCLPDEDGEFTLCDDVPARPIAAFTVEAPSDNAPVLTNIEYAAASTVPEPMSVALLGAGLAVMGVAGVVRRRSGPRA